MQYFKVNLSFNLALFRLNIFSNANKSLLLFGLMLIVSSCSESSGVSVWDIIVGLIAGITTLSILFYGIAWLWYNLGKIGTIILFIAICVVIFAFTPAAGSIYALWISARNSTSGIVPIQIFYIVGGIALILTIISVGFSINASDAWEQRSIWTVNTSSFTHGIPSSQSHISDSSAPIWLFYLTFILNLVFSLFPMPTLFLQVSFIILAVISLIALIAAYKGKGKYLTIKDGSRSIYDPEEEAIKRYMNQTDDIFKAQSLLNQAIELQKNKEWADSLDLATEAGTLAPKQPSILFTIGVSYLNLGKYNEAVLFFEGVLKLDPNFKGAEEALKIAKSML